MRVPALAEGVGGGSLFRGLCGAGARQAGALPFVLSCALSSATIFCCHAQPCSTFAGMRMLLAARAR